MDAKQLLEAADRYDAQLEQSYDRLAPAQDDDEARQLRKVLLDLGRQVHEARRLLQQGRTADAEAAMPSRIAVKEAVRQAEDFFVYGKDNAAPEQSEATESKLEATDQAQPVPIRGRHRAKPATTEDSEDEPSLATILAAVRENALTPEQRSTIAELTEALGSQKLSSHELAAAARFVLDNQDSLDQLLNSGSSKTDDVSGVSAFQAWLDERRHPRKRRRGAHNTDAGYPLV